jgi:molybdenum cofactor cytidylyltransferase
MSSSPTVIVLAAGSGSRFGGARHKLMQRWQETTVLEATLRHAVASHLPLVVVTTQALASSVCEHVAARDVVILPAVGSTQEAPLGVGFSIAAGVAASPNASGWLILPADMPMIQAATLQAVSLQLKQHPVVFAQYAGRRGHPVGFSAELYSELVRLTGDEGAKRLVARYPAFGVTVDDQGIVLDIDTPDDLADALRAHESARQRAVLSDCRNSIS